MFFQTSVDLRSKAAMLAFLRGHFRYYTMNSWNRSTSYAHCVKVPRLGLSQAQRGRAYEMMDLPEVSDMAQSVITDFTEEHRGGYTIGFNGRSSGYLVLYSSQYEVTAHKSRCRSCGQLNFQRVYDGPREGARGIIAAELMRNGCAWTTDVYLCQPAIQALGLPEAEARALVNELRPACKDRSRHNTCGRCHAEGERGRFDLSVPHRELNVWSGRSIDGDADWDELSMNDLKERTRLVQSFDAACDQILEGFIELLDDFQVVESVVMVPRNVRHLEPRVS